MAAAQPVSAQVVGNVFVQNYYHILHQSPALVHRFYRDISKLGRPEEDGAMSITTSMQAINEKILSLNYGEFRAEIKSVDSQISYNGGVHVLVTGYQAGQDNMVRNFAQTFFLAPQENGYFVLNDVFRYVEDVSCFNGMHVSSHDVEAPPTPDQDPSSVQEHNMSEQAVESVEVTGEADVKTSDNEEASFDEELPIAEVVDEAPDDSQMVVESNSRIEEVPKKSYASIVMDKKESAITLSSPVLAPKRQIPKSREQQANLSEPSALAAEVPISRSEAPNNGNNQEGEGPADGCSIYIKGLPLNATPALLEDVFKSFGPIKIDGIQVRSNKLQQQGYCFGFVEFEVATAVEKALQASPIMIGGRQAFVEEKRSTNSRVNNRGRFQAGRSFGFRTEGVRGRGNYTSGSRVYARGDFNSRMEFGNRGSNRGGFSNHRADGYQRIDNGGRMNRAGVIAGNGTVRAIAPRVSASA